MKKELVEQSKLLLKKEFPGKEKADTAKYDTVDKDQDYLLAASSTDCTGLIPSAPQTDAEVDSYEQLQHFLPPNYMGK